jgi:hypothetical protein
MAGSAAAKKRLAPEAIPSEVRDVLKVREHPYAPPLEEDPYAVMLMCEGCASMERRRLGPAERNAEARAEKMRSVKKAAGVYIELCNEQPHAKAGEIYSLMLDKLGVERRTLDDYLAEARRQRLIPLKHAHLKSPRKSKRRPR